jgi:hypothetical protein
MVLVPACAGDQREWRCADRRGEWCWLTRGGRALARPLHAVQRAPYRPEALRPFAGRDTAGQASRGAGAVIPTPPPLRTCASPPSPHRVHEPRAAAARRSFVAFRGLTSWPGPRRLRAAPPYARLPDASDPSQRQRVSGLYKRSPPRRGYLRGGHPWMRCPPCGPTGSTQPASLGKFPPVLFRGPSSAAVLGVGGGVCESGSALTASAPHSAPPRARAHPHTASRARCGRAFHADELTCAPRTRRPPPPAPVPPPMPAVPGASRTAVVPGRPARPTSAARSRPANADPGAQRPAVGRRLMQPEYTRRPGQASPLPAPTAEAERGPARWAAQGFAGAGWHRRSPGLATALLGEDARDHAGAHATSDVPAPPRAPRSSAERGRDGARVPGVRLTGPHPDPRGRRWRRLGNVSLSGMSAGACPPGAANRPYVPSGHPTDQPLGRRFEASSR